MPRGRGIRRQRRQQHYPLLNRRGQVQRDNPQREVEQIAAEPEAVPHVPEVQLPEPEINLPPNAPAHTNTIGVQADNNVINGEDFISENTPLTINNDPLVVPLCNETDLFISQSLKEKIWGLQYINLALLLHQNFDVPSEPKMNSLTVLNGNVVVNTENKNLKVKNIENIESWTDAFCNFAKVALQRHPMLATDLISYMILIRGAVSDALFERVYNYDKQFRLRIAQNPIRSWSQIDGNLWFRFIAKGALGGQLSQQPQIEHGFCYDFNFRKGCFRMNCRYKHVCLKCNGMHPSVLCNTFKNSHVNRSVRAVQNSNLFNRTSSLRQPMAANVNQIRPNMHQTRFSFRPPVGANPQNVRF